MSEETLAKQSFKLEKFEGPLDLLLFLIKKAEINIYDIPIASITQQYIEYMEFAKKHDLDNLSEFYLMAATLLYIKSRMLLPMDLGPDEEWEDPRRELVERLIEYHKYKKLSDLMTQKEEELEWIIERKKKERFLPFGEEEQLWEEIELWDLLQVFTDLIGSLSSEQIIDLYEEVSINEKITLIHEILESKEDCSFTDLIRNPRSVMEIVCSFLAILEAVKSRMITIFQNRLFGDIRIRKYVKKEENGI